MGKTRTTVGRFIHTTWTNLNIRCVNGKYHHLRTKNKCLGYENIRLEVTRDEFRDFCINNKSLIEACTRPSIDRISKQLGYSIDNMQILELADNVTKDKTVFTLTHGVCRGCKQVLPIDLFAKDTRSRNGKHSMCKKCDSARKRVPPHKRQRNRSVSHGT